MAGRKPQLFFYWHRNNPNYNKEWREKNPGYFNYWMKNYRRNSEVGQLRQLSANTAKRLCLGKLTHSRFKLLDYSPIEFKNYLLDNSPFNSFEEVFENNYELDHIVPLSYICENIENTELRFSVVMDLKNQRFISKDENRSKRNRTNSNIVQKTINYLWEKYNL